MQLNAGPEVTERRRAGALRRGLHAPRAVQAGCLCFLLCILVAVVCLVICVLAWAACASARGGGWKRNTGLVLKITSPSVCICYGVSVFPTVQTVVNPRATLSHCRIASNTVRENLEFCVCTCIALKSRNTIPLGGARRYPTRCICKAENHTHC